MDNLIHGGDRYRNRITLDFSVNINPLGIPENIKRIYEETVFKLEYYPDMYSMNLLDKLSDTFKVHKEQLILGNGASELLMASIHSINPRKVVLPVPSFIGYEHVLRAIDSEVIYYQMNKDYSIDEKLLEMLDESVDLLFLTNPNNPTGKYIEKNILEDILIKCRSNNIYVLLDECFIELSDDYNNHTLINQIEKWPNLLILRAFTKTYAVAGVRLGYMTCSDVVTASKIKNHIPEWNVSIIAQELGTALIDEKEYLEKAVRLIKEERKYLSDSLREMDFEVLDSNTNFILFRNKKEDIEWYSELLAEGILIRDCSNYRGLEDRYYRVAVRKHGENVWLINAMNCIKEIRRKARKY